MSPWPFSRRQRPRFTPPADLMLGNLDRLDGLRTCDEDALLAEAERITRDESVRVHAHQLFDVVFDMLRRGHGKHAVLAHLNRPETAQTHGAAAVEVVARVVMERW